jgi:hypothetical protein
MIASSGKTRNRPLSQAFSPGSKRIGNIKWIVQPKTWNAMVTAMITDTKRSGYPVLVEIPMCHKPLKQSQNMITAINPYNKAINNETKNMNGRNKAGSEHYIHK